MKKLKGDIQSATRSFVKQAPTKGWAKRYFDHFRSDLATAPPHFKKHGITWKDILKLSRFKFKWFKLVFPKE